MTGQIDDDRRGLFLRIRTTDGGSRLMLGWLLDIGQRINARKNMMTTSATNQSPTQLQLIWNDLEAGLALRAGGREGHRD